MKGLVIKLDSALEQAIAKRDRIIRREGDGNGIRLEPWYLEMLLAEVVLEDCAAQKTGGHKYG